MCNLHFRFLHHAWAHFTPSNWSHTIHTIPWFLKRQFEFFSGLLWNTLARYWLQAEPMLVPASKDVPSYWYNDARFCLYISFSWSYIYIYFNGFKGLVQFVTMQVISKYFPCFSHKKYIFSERKHSPSAILMLNIRFHHSH